MYRNEEEGFLLVSGTLSAFHARPETVELENRHGEGRTIAEPIAKRTLEVGLGALMSGNRKRSKQNSSPVRENLGQRGQGYDQQ
jgi:hypothetical protein